MFFSKGNNVIRQDELCENTSQSFNTFYTSALGKDSNIYITKAQKICRYCRENGSPINAFIKRIDVIKATGKQFYITDSGNAYSVDFVDKTIVYATRNDDSIFLIDNMYAELLKNNDILFRVTDNGIMWIISGNTIYASLDGSNWQHYDYPVHQLYALWSDPQNLKVEHIYTDSIGQTKIVLVGPNIKIEGRIYCSFNFTNVLNLAIHIEF